MLTAKYSAPSVPAVHQWPAHLLCEKCALSSEWPSKCFSQAKLTFVSTTFCCLYLPVLYSFYFQVSLCINYKKIEKTQREIHYPIRIFSLMTSIFCISVFKSVVTFLLSSFQYSLYSAPLTTAYPILFQSLIYLQIFHRKQTENVFCLSHHRRNPQMPSPTALLTSCF